MPKEFLPDGECPQLVFITPVNSHDVPVSAVAAASSIIGILGQTRTVNVPPSGPSGASSGPSGASSGPSGAPGGPSGAPSGQKDPLGELVNVNLELAGLRGQPVLLSWSIFQGGSHTSLFGKWLRDFAAYRLEATTNDDTATLEMWIPLPKLPGPYFIHLSLTTDGVGLASANSDMFD